MKFGEFRCGVCGLPARPPPRMPPAEQSPDLDLRPGEPARSTLPDWVRTCAGCAAAAPDLSRLGAAAPVATAAYRALRDEPAGTLRFRRWALLCPRGERHEALLWAAWTADDAGLDASGLRRAALAVWPDPAEGHDALRRIDVLRRAGLLKAASAECRSLAARMEDPVLAFQRDLIAAGDTGRHRLGSALRPPAATPHVAHGPFKSRGVWARLVGR